MIWKRLVGSFKLLFIGIVIVLSFAPEWPVFQDEQFKIDAILGRQYFDFVVWEVQALLAKGEASITKGDDYLSAESRINIVLDYVDLMGHIRELNAQIAFIYSDPEISNPEEIARGYQEELQELRAQLGKIQPVAESIVQDQVASILVEEGFDLWNQAWPPVQMRVTPLPYVLIVSPREEIRQIYNLSLEPGLTIPERDGIEVSIYDSIDRSALVEPISGIGIYPSMVIETGSINQLVDTVSHEWAHHWLTLHPLGIRYAASPEMRTINETVANILGNEIGSRVIERYYPEFAPPPASVDAEAGGEEKGRFDIAAEMRETRVEVDRLLEEGLVDEAEDYMESRRLYFWENGYRYRKINQAYFAFYGAYADTPGRRGSDPIGPTLLTLRENSRSLREFMDEVARITAIEDLEQLAGEQMTS